MAIEKILSTRIINKHDSLTNWNSSSLKLKEGEIALAYVETTKPDGHGGSYTVPTYLMKVGVEGKTFSELEWLAAPASDVYAWAKLENPTVDQLPTNLQTAIKNLQSAVGDGGSVAESIANAINALDSESTGEGTIVKSVVQTDGKVTVTMGTLSADEIPTLDIDKIDGLQDALDDKVAIEEGKSLIADTEIARLAAMSDGANKVEASATNGSIKIDGVDTVVYTHPDKHTSADISDFDTAVAAVKVANATKADEATKATQDGNGKVIADTYAEKATTLAGYGIGDAYTKDEVDGEIEGAINTFVSAYITSDGGAIDKLQEIANWIDSDKNGSADIIADVEANTEAIENLGGRLDDAEDAIEAIHNHENKDVLDGITADKVSAWDAAEGNAKTHADGLNTAMDTRVKGLEDAKATYGDIVTHNVNEFYTKEQADAAFTDSTEVDGQIDAKITALDLANTYQAKGEYATATQGSKADSALQEITTTENGGLKVTNKNQIDFDENIVFVFDCGDSGVNA